MAPAGCVLVGCILLGFAAPIFSCTALTCTFDPTGWSPHCGGVEHAGTSHVTPGGRRLCRNEVLVCAFLMRACALACGGSMRAVCSEYTHSPWCFSSLDCALHSCRRVCVAVCCNSLGCLHKGGWAWQFAGPCFTFSAYTYCAYSLSTPRRSSQAARSLQSAAAVLGVLGGVLMDLSADADADAVAVTAAARPRPYSRVDCGCATCGRRWMSTLQEQGE